VPHPEATVVPIPAGHKVTDDPKAVVPAERQAPPKPLEEVARDRFIISCLNWELKKRVTFDELQKSARRAVCLSEPVDFSH